MPLEIKLDNPAGRLYWLLSNARAHNGGNSGQAFATLLHFDQNDIMQMHMRFGTTMYAIKETADLLQQVDMAYYERFLEAQPTITRFFTSFNPGIDWNQYKASTLNEADLRTLSFCSEVLSRAVPDAVVSADELKELAAQLEELYQNVVSAKIDVKLRTEILDGLEKVRQAIHEYHISGGQGLKKAFSVLAVAAATNEKNDRQDESSDTEQEDWHKQLWRFVEHLGRILTIAVNLHALSAPAQKMLEAASRLGH